ncbi:hypothetical protein MNBD_ALPHA11-1681 [hydrothermal vent metagenome]|uniref:DUF1203 domain-containing protein n=1 Tax=hydrothermal vent metagenome TaxID=652676 RepID=A0A3B0TKB9_9ZZZZ
MPLKFHPYDSSWVAQIRNGGVDDYAQPTERSISDGVGNPCRHCLQFIPEGEGFLICAARPFPELQPYAETGPIFLCAANCVAWAGQGIPPVLRHSPNYLLKGYSADYRIVYGTGKITPTDDIERTLIEILMQDKVAFVDVRSALNNCFLCRVISNPSARG